MLNLNRIILLSGCLTILFVAPFARAQDTPTVLKPNQLITYSLVPKQEKSFVLQMKKGDFAEIQFLAREGLEVSLVIYDESRKEIFEKSHEADEPIWFIAPTDGDFILVGTLGEAQNSGVSNVERISVQYNNKFKLPPGTKLKAIQKVNGYDIKIMATPEESIDWGSILLIEKSGQLQKAMKQHGGFNFPGGNSAELTRELRTKRDKGSRTFLLNELKSVQLIDSTPDKTGDGVPDIMVDYFSGGAHCCFATYFFDLGDTVKLAEILDRENNETMTVRKNPKGGLLFEINDWAFAYWLTSFAQSPAPTVILEFKNGKLRPNFDQMKKPPPSLAVLNKKAQVYRQQFRLEPYLGEKNENCRVPGFRDMEGRMVYFTKPCLLKEDATEPVFWGTMLDLIYTGNEELAWQFLDLVWPPQKQGKELFVRDFKNQLLKGWHWPMILEDQNK